MLILIQQQWYLKLAYEGDNSVLIQATKVAREWILL
jgi:hypothetical protein